MKNTLLALFILMLSTTCYSQNKRTAVLKLNYVFFSTGKTNKVVFTFTPPISINNAQKVIKVEYSPRPDTTPKPNGTNHVQFTFDPVSDTNRISIVVTLEISEFDLKSAKNFNSIQPDTSSFSEYLQSERFIESDTEQIKLKAEQLAAKTCLKTLKNIFNFTLKQVKYTGYSRDEHGALYALETKGGDCSEFSDLFVALCRANGIPARIVYGFTTEYDFTPRHAWAEAYTNEYGWVRFDPTTGQALSFNKLRNIYIQLPDNIDEPELGNGRYYYVYRYWGDPIIVKETINISKSLPHY